ncbi:adenylyltransferase/cytidyltransferase family protein [Candidatus Woesearchaeota archaeon]|nr:adenylyltransferase/cytidyltransferase family protein [Candidatus Woesearchaeota archaeon]
MVVIDEKKVMVFGSFDVLHDGHRALFKQAKKHGKLVVVVARDTSIRHIKNRRSRQPEIKRHALVRAEKTVDKAVLGHTEDFFLVIEREKPNAIMLGYDQAPRDTRGFVRRLAQRGLRPRIFRGKAYKAHKLKSSKIAKNE